MVWVVSRAWLCLAQLGSDWEGFVRGFVGVGKERRLGRGGGKVRRERKEEGEKERRREKEEGRQGETGLRWLAPCLLLTDLSSVTVPAVFGVCVVLRMCDVHYRREGEEE